LKEATVDTTKLAALCAICATTASALAQTDGVSGSTPETHPWEASATGSAEGSSAPSLVDRADPRSEFHVSLTPYFWLTSFSGNIEAEGIEVDIDKSVIDLLNGTDKLFGLMGALDLDYKRFVFQINAAWGTVEGSEEKAIFHNGTLDADVTVEGAFMELFGGYRLVDTPLGKESEDQDRFKLDAYGGVRRTAINVDMTLHATASITLPGGQVLSAGRSEEISQSGDWFEPFVGLRGIFDLDDHWMIQIRGDVGGFGFEGSEFAWQAAAVLGYRWHFDNWDFAVVGGYRALSQDYSSGDFSWDVVTHGPLLGMSFAWSF
jgi:hypothetical protein